MGFEEYCSTFFLQNEHIHILFVDLIDIRPLDGHPAQLIRRRYGRETTKDKEEGSEEPACPVRICRGQTPPTCRSGRSAAALRLYDEAISLRAIVDSTDSKRERYNLLALHCLDDKTVPSDWQPSKHTTTDKVWVEKMSFTTARKRMITKGSRATSATFAFYGRVNEYYSKQGGDYEELQVAPLLHVDFSEPGAVIFSQPFMGEDFDVLVKRGS